MTKRLASVRSNLVIGACRGSEKWTFYFTDFAACGRMVD